jgi:hypothetical protein
VRIVTDPDKQREFLAGLRRAAEAAAAKNPILADKRILAKALVDEARTRIEKYQDCPPVGAYMQNDGQVSTIPAGGESSVGKTEILSTLKSLAAEGKIRAAAFCEIRDRQIPAGPVLKFIQIHMEHVAGKPFLSAVPVDESALTASTPGVDGPALSVFGGPTTPMIFLPATDIR